MTEIPARIARWIVIGLAVATLVSLLLSLAMCGPSKTEVNLGKAQTEAAQKSGADGVQTVGNVMGNEAAGDRITQENDNAIDHANGSDAVVHGDARAAGVQSLCRRASYRASHPECL